MKNWLLLIISLCLISNLQSQNLIQNPFFERDLSKPCFDLMFNGWEASLNGAGTLMFHDCQSLPVSSVLGTIGLNDLPYPYFGNGYWGIIGKHLNQNVSRNYASSFLSDTLALGINYVLEFHYRPWARNNYHIDRLEFHVGNIGLNDSIYSNYTPSGGINIPINDTLEWVLFSAGFVAKGGESVLNIGNISPDALINKITNNLNGTNQTNAYRWPLIFIDAVFLYKATDTLYTVNLQAEI